MMAEEGETVAEGAEVGVVGDVVAAASWMVIAGAKADAVGEADTAGETVEECKTDVAGTEMDAVGPIVAGAAGIIVVVGEADEADEAGETDAEGAEVDVAGDIVTAASCMVNAGGEADAVGEADEADEMGEAEAESKDAADVVEAAVEDCTPVAGAGGAFEDLTESSVMPASSESGVRVLVIARHAHVTSCTAECSSAWSASSAAKAFSHHDRHMSIMKKPLQPPRMMLDQSSSSSGSSRASGQHIAPSGHREGGCKRVHHFFQVVTNRGKDLISGSLLYLRPRPVQYFTSSGRPFGDSQLRCTCTRSTMNRLTGV
jgi:hypothetical protein